MMKRARPLRTKHDLRDYLIGYTPSKACDRAISEGRYSVLGVFDDPQYLFTVGLVACGKYNKRWLLTLHADTANQVYRTRWDFLLQYGWWVGKEDGTHPITDGDIPHYMQRRLLNGPATLIQPEEIEVKAHPLLGRSRHSLG